MLTDVTAVPSVFLEPCSRKRIRRKNEKRNSPAFAKCHSLIKFSFRNGRSLHDERRHLLFSRLNRLMEQISRVNAAGKSNRQGHAFFQQNRQLFFFFSPARCHAPPSPVFILVYHSPKHMRYFPFPFLFSLPFSQKPLLRIHRTFQVSKPFYISVCTSIKKAV